MSLFTTTTDRRISLGLAILRVVVGATFVAHGAQKLFVFGFGGVSGMFAKMGIPMPGLLGPFVALVEFFGGLAILSGLLTRLAAMGVGATMVVAILTVHLKAGFFNPGGVEFPLSLLGSALALIVTGAGLYSVDAQIAKGSTSGVDATTSASVVADARARRTA